MEGNGREGEKKEGKREERENAKMGLEVGLDETGKADLGNCRNIVTVSAILGQR